MARFWAGQPEVHSSLYSAEVEPSIPVVQVRIELLIKFWVGGAIQILYSHYIP